MWPFSSSGPCIQRACASRPCPGSTARVQPLYLCIFVSLRLEYLGNYSGTVSQLLSSCNDRRFKKRKAEHERLFLFRNETCLTRHAQIGADLHLVVRSAQPRLPPPNHFKALKEEDSLSLSHFEKSPHSPTLWRESS